MTFYRILIPIISFFLVSCQSSNEDVILPTNPAITKFTPQETFDWDLRSDLPINSQYTSKVVDIDAFDNSAALVKKFHDQGKKVIAYISVGSVENWRSDAADFPASIIGNNYDGWDGEKFLDIRRIDVLAPIMRARLDMIKAKGFDAVEPDNIDSYTSNTGFAITEQDVIDYCKWLANEAHSRGLAIGQKNATELASQLVDTFDWALLEGAFKEGIENEAQIYITKNKAVFATEYDDVMSVTEFQNTVCPSAKTLQYSAIFKHRELDDYRVSCD